MALVVPPHRCCCSTSRCPVSTRSSGTPSPRRLRDIRTRLGVTVVLVEHDVESVVRLADRLVVLGLRREAGRRPDVGDPHQHQGARGLLRLGGAGVIDRPAPDEGGSPRPRLRLENVSHSYGALPALRNVTHRRARRARCAPSSAPTAPASRRWRRPSPVWCRPARDRCCSTARTSARLARHARARRGRGVRARGRRPVPRPHRRREPRRRRPRRLPPGAQGDARAGGRRCSRSSPSDGTSGPGMLSGGEQQMVSLSRVLGAPVGGRRHRRAVARPRAGHRRAAVRRAGQLPRRDDAGADRAVREAGRTSWPTRSSCCPYGQVALAPLAPPSRRWRRSRRPTSSTCPRPMRQDGSGPAATPDRTATLGRHRRPERGGIDAACPRD